MKYPKEYSIIIAINNGICRLIKWIIVIGVTYLKKTNSFRCAKVNHGLFSFQMSRIILDDVYWF